MAKNTVEIDVKVDDKGTTKKVGLGAKKAAKDTDSLSRSSREASKNVKGVAQTASAGGKNFAGMARGMGGLVGAYAALAAQMFAISAAFQFFKKAGDLEVLKAGQQAYAGATGVAMRTLATDIQHATDAQITFRDASQAAAIGIASGLSPEQLTRLGTAAKDAAAILGRDVTDAFNRLVRGVTKAEPELLDELGIILRLEKANENYALSLGILAKDLTQFQKSQAVANEVLNQSESKYSAILAITGGGSVNQFNKLGKSMDDIVMKIQNFLLPVANAFADVFISLPLVGMAAFGLLLKGPLNAMGLSLVGMRDSAVAAAAARKAEYEAIKVGSIEAQREVDILNRKMSKTGSKLADRKGLAKPSPTLTALKDKGGYGNLNKKEQQRVNQALKAVEGRYKQHEIITKGIFKGLKYSMVSDMVNGLNQIEQAHIKLARTSKGVWHSIQVGAAFAKSAVISFGATLMTVGQTLMKWLGWLGILVTLIQMAYSMFSEAKEKTSMEVMLERTTEKVKSLIDEYADMMAIQKVWLESQPGEGGERLGAAMGQRIGGLSNEQQIITMKEYIKFQEKSARTGYESHAARLKQMQEERGFFNNYIGGIFRIAMMDADNIYQARIEVSTRKESGWLSFFTDQADLVSDAGERAKAYFTDQEELLQLFMDTQEGGSKAFEAYQKGLENFRNRTAGKALTKEDVEEYNRLKDAAEGVGNAFKSIPSLKQAATDSANKFFISLAPLTAADGAIAKYKTEWEGLKIVIDDATNVSKNDPIRQRAKARQAEITEEIRILDILNEAEKQRKIRTIKQTQASATAADIDHKLLKDLAVQNEKVNTVKDKYTGLLEKQHELELSIRRAQKLKEGEQIDEEALTGPQRRANELLAVQIALEKELLRIATKKNNALIEEFELRVAIQGATQLKAMGNFDANFLKQEYKLQEALNERIKIESDLEAVLIARQTRSDQLSNPFAYLGSEKKTNDMKIDALELEKEAKIEQIEAERRFKLEMLKIEEFIMQEKWKLLGAQMGAKLIDAKKASVLSLQAANAFRAANSGQGSVALNASAKNDADEVFNLESMIASASAVLAQLPEITRISGDNINAVAKNKTFGLQDAIDKLTHANYLLSDMGKLTDGLAHSLESNMSSAFEGIINGTMSMKNAFGSMAMGILKHLSKMIAELLAAKMIMMMMGMVGGAFVPSKAFSAGQANMNANISAQALASTAIPGGGNRYGGVMSNGKKMQGYATGGVARGSTSGYPATLHGTEAVVPLPNGRSIPVDMKDSGATNNNIVVNISSDGQSNTQGSTGPDMDKMGGAIARAVQVELQNQKRSGGILNPYGVA